MQRHKLNYGYLGLDATKTADTSWANCFLALQYEDNDVLDGDKSPDARTVTASGDAALSTDQIKFAAQSISLDGTGDFLTISGSAADWQTLINNDFTFQMWVYHNAVSAEQRYIHLGVEAAAASYCALSVSATNKLQLHYKGSGTSDQTTSGSLTVSDSTWHHVAMVRSGDVIYVFLDGALDFQITTSADIGTPATYAILGYDAYDTGDYLNGYIGSALIHEGSALWTTTFNVPTRAEPTRALPSGLKHPLIESTSTLPNLVTADYFVVGGGGGGGDAGSNEGGGGGGAGEVQEGEQILSTCATYTVTVGAGGARHANGSNSVFDAVTALGGGNGARPNNNSAGNGGSGGGGAGGTDTVGGTATGTGFGNGGGNGIATGQSGGGGGGGAGASGSNGNVSDGGAGGTGRSNDWTGSTEWFAGGGGAGSGQFGNQGLGGSGVGGDGGEDSSATYPTAGTTNTGSGGGGGAKSPYQTAGAGGSGVVRIRYLGVQRFTGGTVSSSGGYTVHEFTASGSLAPS